MMQNDNNENIIEAARDYIKRGWSPIPIPFRAKSPIMQGWQKLQISETDAPKYFNGKPQNIGVLLGEKSGGLVDIDLDSPEAVKLADWFLPKTQAIFGRKGKRASHRLYICEDAEYQKFNNPLMMASLAKDERKNACIIEIRTSNNGKGIQTVFPPSVHESGEAIEWQEKGEPLRVSAADLKCAVGKLAAASLLAKYWRGGIRHDLAMAVSGALLRHEFTKDEVRHFIKAICSVANDEETPDRLQTVEDTSKTLANGEKAFGFPKLAELTDDKIVKSIGEWLKFESKTNGEFIETDETKKSGFRVICLNDVQAEEIVWLWKPFIAIGEFTIVEGIEGLGKSWACCALGCAVGDGKKLPFSESEPIEPSNVLMLSAEDSLSHTIKPRLVGMNANLNRIFALDEVFSLDNPKDLIRFEAVIAEYQPKLVIVDPIFSYTGGKNLNTESDSRPLARKLIAIAQKYNCAIIGVRHIGKAKGNGDARAAGLGSIAWRASARSVLLIGQDEETGEKAICQTKNNLASESKIAIGFEIENGKFYWKAAPSSLTKEKMLAQPKNDETKAEQTEAVAFLREVLSDGEKSSKDIEKEAKELNITKYAFRKAKAFLSVESFKKGGNFGGENAWYLRLPNAEVVETKTEDVDVSEIQHLQPNQSDKTSYGNNLAEDVELRKNRQVQHVQPTSSNGLVPNARMKAVCKCGADGFVAENCFNCGEVLIPF